MWAVAGAEGPSSSWNRGLPGYPPASLSNPHPSRCCDSLQSFRNSMSRAVPITGMRADNGGMRAAISVSLESDKQHTVVVRFCDEDGQVSTDTTRWMRGSVEGSTGVMNAPGPPWSQPPPLRRLPALNTEQIRNLVRAIKGKLMERGYTVEDDVATNCESSSFANADDNPLVGGGTRPAAVEDHAQQQQQREGIEFMQVQRLFHLTVREAASALGCCTTTLKKVGRHGHRVCWTQGRRTAQAAAARDFCSPAPTHPPTHTRTQVCREAGISRWPYRRFDAIARA